MNKHTLEEKVSSYMEENQMLQPGDAVVVGVSGGADSVCLLFLLCKLREQLQLKLQVVHVNHGLRETAERDSQFVRHLCEKWNVPVTCVTFPVSTLAKEQGLTIEEAGRKVRYEAFEKAASELAASHPELPREPRIGVAHHAGDNAETMLFHLIRGTGLRGLAGIPPVRGNIIRPLLCAEREEIEECLKAAEIPWVTDETNDDDTYVRNKIRHRMIPEAEKMVQGSVLHMFDASKRLREVEDYLREQTDRAVLDLCGQKQENPAKSSTDTYDISVISLQTYHIALQERVILRFLESLSPGGRDIGSLQVDQVLDLVTRPGNREIHLPFGLRAERSYDRLRIYRAGDAEGASEVAAEPEGHIEVTFPGSESLKDVDFRAEFTENPYTKYMDYDKINKSFVLRTRREGDFIRICGKEGELASQSLKNYFINSKIPAALRDRIPLMAFGSEVYWIIGYRMSDAVKILQDTANIIRVDYKKE